MQSISYLKWWLCVYHRIYLFMHCIHYTFTSTMIFNTCSMNSINSLSGSLSHSLRVLIIKSLSYIYIDSVLLLFFSSHLGSHCWLALRIRVDAKHKSTLKEVAYLRNVYFFLPSFKHTHAHTHTQFHFSEHIDYSTRKSTYTHIYIMNVWSMVLKDGEEI